MTTDNQSGDKPTISPRPPIGAGLYNQGTARPDDAAVRCPPPCAKQRSGGGFFHSCLVAGCATLFAPIALTVGIAVFVYLLSAYSGAGGAGGPLDLSGEATSNAREKVLRSGKTGANTIAIIGIQGEIAGDGSTIEGTGMVAWVSEQLRAAAKDDNVKVILLQVDSPGGGLTASDQLHNEVLKAKAKGKKILAWAGNIMASGGYYIAVGAEGIMASPTATVGSIGVSMRRFEIADLMKTLGVKADFINSGDHKDIGSPFRPMTPEERKTLDEYVMQSHRRFVDIVAKGRGMPLEKVLAVADGSIFTADDAVANGLVDRIGYIEDALAWAEERAGEKEMRVIAYRRLRSFGDLFMDAGGGMVKALVGAAAEERSPGAMAKWDGR